MSRLEVEHIQVQIKLVESVRRLLADMIQYCIMDSVKDALQGVAARQEHKPSLLRQDLCLAKEDVTR